MKGYLFLFAITGIGVGGLWNANDIRKLQEKKTETQRLKQENDLLIKTINELNHRIVFIEDGIPEIVKRNTRAKYIKNLILENIKETKVNNFKSESELNQYAFSVVDYSDKFKVPVSLVLAISRAESNFNPRAVSPVGAKGIMQIMDTTMSACAFKLHKSSYDVFWVKDNVEAGVYYLSYLKGIFGNSNDNVVRSYNSGPQAVKMLALEDLPKETIAYHERVMQYMEFYKAKLYWEE